MPKLQEYVAPSRELRPENQGYQAYETAARRVGGMFRETASSTIAAAKAAGQTLVDKAQWPFTLFELKRKFDTAAKPAADTETTASGLSGFGVRKSRASVTDEQFAPRIMPSLYAANLSTAGAENTSTLNLSREGAHSRTLAGEAARLTNQLRGLIGSTGPFTTMPGTGPNADAEASANAWGQSISGQSNPTGVSVTDTSNDYGGYNSPTSTNGFTEAFPAPAASGVNEAAGLALYPQF